VYGIEQTLVAVARYNTSMNDYPLVSRATPVALATPVIPLNFIYPGLSLAQMTSIVWAHRRLTLLIVLLVASLTALGLKYWPRTYTATATLMVNYEVNDPSNGKELPLGQVASYIATQVELMQTPGVLLTVVDRLNLTSDEDYARGYRSDRGTLREWVAAKVAKVLTVAQSPLGSQLIFVTYSASSAEEAAQVANAVADVYREQDTARSTGPPAERARRYAQQLAELKNKVNQAQQEVTAFHQRNGVVDQGGKSNVEAVSLANLEARLLEAQNTRRAAEARATQDPAVSEPVLSSNHVQELRVRLATQEMKLAELSRNYTQEYPNLRESQSQVADIRHWIAVVEQGYAANAAAGLTLAQRQEQSLQRAVADQRAKVLAQEHQVLAQARLRDEAAKNLLELESAQSVYKRALDGYDQIMFASGHRATNVSVVSRATPPVSAAKPKVISGIVLGAIAALVLGLGIPLGGELFNRRVRCRDDLERQNGVPVLVEFGRLPLGIAR
jgi:polysaccharide biosynthesis transport protein